MQKGEGKTRDRSDNGTNNINRTTNNRSLNNRTKHHNLCSPPPPSPPPPLPLRTHFVRRHVAPDHCLREVVEVLDRIGQICCVQELGGRAAPKQFGRRVEIGLLDEAEWGWVHVCSWLGVGRVRVGEEEGGM